MIITRFEFLLVITTLITQPLCFGQEHKRLTPSEKREQDRANSVSKEVFKAADKDVFLTETSVPDKWKNGSAVIIGIKSSYSYMREDKGLSRQNIKITELVQKRIKLLDKAAVEEFSKIYFYTMSDYSENTHDFGLKITKADGQVSDVNTKDAVDINTDIPYLFQSYYYYSSVKYKKLAVPDLQPGDIIDYYLRTEYVRDASVNEINFDPFVFTLNSTYPIMNQEFNFTVDRGFYINFASYNNAPELVEGNAGIDKNGRQRATIKTYKLIDKDRGEISKDMWYYSRLVNPYVKFQVYYEVPSMVDATTNFIGEVGKVKNNVPTEEVQQIITRRVDQSNQMVKNEITNRIGKYLRAVKETDPKKLVELIYYYFRFLTTDIYYNPGEYFPGSTSTTSKDYFSIDENIFVSVLMEVFNDKKIKSEIVVIVPKSKGSTKDILLANDYDLGVRVEDLVLLPFNNHSTIRYSNYLLDGADAYSFTPLKNKRLNNTTKIVMPPVSFSENIYNASSEVIIDDAMEMVKVKRKNTLNGYSKSGSVFLILGDYDYKRKDLKKYDPKRYEKEIKEELNPRGNKARNAEDQRKLKTDKEDRTKAHLEKLKNGLEDDFDDILSYDKFEVLEDGRDDDSFNLIYSEEFTLKNLLNKAGRNYSLNIGKLLSKQLELKEKDMKRDNDIYISYGKVLNNDITLTIPSGYTAEGLSELNFNVDNESGSFVSLAKQDGNKLIINTKKVYKKNFDKKENWQNWISMLETAYKFTQKKVILKKV